MKRTILFSCFLISILSCHLHSQNTDCDNCSNEYGDRDSIMISDIKVYFEAKSCPPDFDIKITDIVIPDSYGFDEDDLLNFMQNLVEQIALLSPIIGNDYSYLGSGFRLNYGLCAKLDDITGITDKKLLTFCSDACCYLEYEAVEENDCVKVLYQISTFKGDYECIQGEGSPSGCVNVCRFDHLLK